MQGYSSIYWFFCSGFQIVNIAFHLKLTSCFSKLQPVFSESKLKLYVTIVGDDTSSNTQPIIVDGAKKYEAENIVAQCSHGNN